MNNATIMKTNLTIRAALFALAIIILTGPLPGLAQDGTPGMRRRQARRDDRGDRLQQRDDQWVERRADPIGVRGPQRREDRRELRDDRRTDRRERVY
jgi:hypothetical protein